MHPISSSIRRPLADHRRVKCFPLPGRCQARRHQRPLPGSSTSAPPAAHSRPPRASPEVAIALIGKHAYSASPPPSTCRRSVSRPHSNPGCWVRRASARADLRRDFNSVSGAPRRMGSSLFAALCVFIMPRSSTRFCTSFTSAGLLRHSKLAGTATYVDMAAGVMYSTACVRLT